MNAKTNTFDCLLLLLQPVIRFCLGHSIRLQDLTEGIKRTLVRVAIAEMEKTDVPVTISRISVMTGLHRRDVTRIYRQSDQPKERSNLILKIIGQWQQNRTFQTPNGKSRVLQAEGAASEFVQLVHSVSQDLNPYTVLYELERINAIEHTKKGVKLRARLYLAGKDLKEGCSMVSEDMNDLISAVEENITTKQATPNLHVRTTYDNIPSEFLPQIKQWFFDEGSTLHERTRAYVSQFDRDINPGIKQGKDRCRVVLGSFSRAEVIK